MATGTPLGEDFPGKEELEAGGVTTLERVREMSDEELDDIEGVGPATIAKIRAAQDGGASEGESSEGEASEAPSEETLKTVKGKNGTITASLK